MNKRATGIFLIGFALVLFVFRNAVTHISAAVLASNSSSTGFFKTVLEQIPSPYSRLPEIILLICGVTYIVWGEINKE